jgi:hypothetical protein
MFRRILLFSTLFVVFPHTPVAAQQSRAAAPTAAQQSPAARQSAMNILEGVLASTGSLSLPQNRLVIELQAFPILWSRSDSRARALINQMAGEFAQAASSAASSAPSSNESDDENPATALARRREQRTTMARTIAASDAEMALMFLAATLPYVQSSSRNDDPEDHALVIDLAAQVALHNPGRALQLAEQQLKEADDLPPSFIDLLEQVERNNSQAGAQLFRDAVDHIKQQTPADDASVLSFAASLLASQFSRQSENGGTPDSTLRALAEIVATSGLSSKFLQDQPYVVSNALSDCWSALDSLLPAKSAALRQNFSPNAATNVPVQNVWQNFNQASTSGDMSKLLAAIAEAPEGRRDNMMQQAARRFARGGDLQQTRMLAQGLEPWQRNNILQQAIRNASEAAGHRGDFASARQLAAQVTDENSRATLLSALALSAIANGKPRLAEEMLGEATSLVMNHTAGTSAFSAQLVVAEAYLKVNPAEAVPLLERSARQIEQALSAAAQLDGFLPDSHSFEGGELILNQGFLYQSLLQPYADATADLAALDLAAARTLADRIPLPEARLVTELSVARGVLTEKDQVQTTSNIGFPERQLLLEQK